MSTRDLMYLLLSPAMIFLFLLLLNPLPCTTSQKTCPRCGPMEVPYPLSTDPSCGDPDYALSCDSNNRRLYFNALNGSSYLVLSIQPSAQRMVVQPSPWLPGSVCVTQDMPRSEGFWLNQSLPFNVTSSNTVFFFKCSPRLLVSPLNCTPTSLCHRYLEASGHVDLGRALQCEAGSSPCCTFVAGGLPSAYKIRLHSSGCRAFRSVLYLDPARPPDQWEEGLEIQWASPSESICRTERDCSGTSTCVTSKVGSGPSRCLCNAGYRWDPVAITCSRNSHHHRSDFTPKLAIGVSTSFVFILVLTVFVVRSVYFRTRIFRNQLKVAKEREDMLKASCGGRPARMFGWKEIKRATDGFSKERLLGSGGFGEVYKGVLDDGTVVAIKSARVGDVKSTSQVLNEVGILSMVSHKNLVKLLGCCVEAEQPLMVYEYIPNGTLHDHLHGDWSHTSPLEWKQRLGIALQTAEALAYLHSSVSTPIYHRDVKSNNILLDEMLNAKVSDFGLSRLAQPGLSHVSTCAHGTVGYLDPEYYKNYQLTDKSDVYSFGVVLLELLTSQKAVDFSRDPDDVNLAAYAGRLAEKGEVMEVADGRLLEGMPSREAAAKGMELFAELALCCLHEKKEERPSMKEAVEVLQYIIGTLPSSCTSESAAVCD